MGDWRNWCHRWGDGEPWADFIECPLGHVVRVQVRLESDHSSVEMQRMIPADGWLSWERQIIIIHAIL